MDQGAIIDQLEELAGRFGIQIRYEPIKQDEDLVRVVNCGFVLSSGNLKPHFPYDEVKISW